MSLDTLRDALPAYAKDISLNLGSLASETVLNDQQKWGAFVASAHAVGEPAVIRAIEAAADAAGLSAEAKTAAKSAAAIMGMNNVYYRFRHMIGKESYGERPARLRMNRLVKPAGKKVDFELYALAASAVGGCESCMRSHERVVCEGGLTEEQVHDAVRIAATIHAAAIALEVA